MPPELKNIPCVFENEDYVGQINVSAGHYQARLSPKHVNQLNQPSEPGKARKPAK